VTPRRRSSFITIEHMTIQRDGVGIVVDDLG